MKILHISNIVSHHQLPLARELALLMPSNEFLFAAMGKPDDERLKNGWKNEHAESWIIYPNDSLESKEKFNRFFDQADVILCGERLIDEMHARVAAKKLCFYMSERWFKPPLGVFRLLHPSYLLMCLKFNAISKSDYFHYLAIGRFAKRDFNLITSMQDRTWSWGYFTGIPPVKIEYEKISPPKLIKILWVGRMLKWKCVDLLIKAVAKLINENYSIKLTLIGDGPERKKLEALANSILMQSSYSFCDFVPTDKVLPLMMQHHIYVLPSNGYEGWGAVINEAMSAGCAVISSDMTGVGSAIIENRKNGLLFKSGCAYDLYICIKNLLDDEDLFNKVRSNARFDIEKYWQPSVVAKRFIELSSSLIDNIPINGYLKGPLSR